MNNKTQILNALSEIILIMVNNVAS